MLSRMQKRTKNQEHKRLVRQKQDGIKTNTDRHTHKHTHTLKTQAKPTHPLTLLNEETRRRNRAAWTLSTQKRVGNAIFSLPFQPPLRQYSAPFPVPPEKCRRSNCAAVRRGPPPPRLILPKYLGRLAVGRRSTPIRSPVLVIHTGTFLSLLPRPPTPSRSVTS